MAVGKPQLQEGLAVLMPSEICGKSADLSFPKE